MNFGFPSNLFTEKNPKNYSKGHPYTYKYWHIIHVIKQSTLSHVKGWFLVAFTKTPIYTYMCIINIIFGISLITSLIFMQLYIH